MADAAVRSGGTETRGWLGRLVDFYRGVMAEMRKVTWPDFAQVRSATFAILIFVLILGLVITILDYALGGILVNLIPSLLPGR
jgi:preprotein translocase subunit SecE